MRWVSRLVTAGIAVALVGVIVLVVVISVREHDPYGFDTSAAFRDGSKLPVGSRVMIAGVQVGRIHALTIDGRLARIELKLRDDIELYEDAWAEKKAESLFGDGYIEIHPGTPEGHRRLVSGDPIPRVHEGASPDRTLRAVDQAIPRAQEVLDGATRFAEEARRTVSGPLAERLEEIDRALQDPELMASLHDVDDALGEFDDSLADAEGAVADFRPRVAPALDDAHEGITGVTADMREGRADLQEALAGARTRIDEVDPYLDEAADVIARLDGSEPREEQGAMARLINDPELGEEIDDVTRSVADATGALQAGGVYVGLRLEFNVLARNTQVALGIQGRAGHDSFYLLEVERGGVGFYPSVQLSDRPGDDVFVHNATIDEGIRFTAQWGRRFGDFSVRFGVRESEAAVGVDQLLLDGHLELHADVFLPSYARVPRVKLTAALRVIEAAYIMAGVDDMLQQGYVLPVMPWPPEQDVPGSLETMHVGRDLIVGGYLRFSDQDLDTLLLLYGAAIFAVL